MSDPRLRDEYVYSAQFYDNIECRRRRLDAEYFVKAAIASGGPVLELGCGTGRLLLQTAKAGIEVTGLDLSPTMLGMCREKLQAETEAVRSRVSLIEGDLRTFKLKKRFTLITIPFRPFQHLLTVPDQLACLERIRLHLAPDGRFILDLFNPSLEILLADENGREAGEPETIVLLDGRKVRRQQIVRSKDLLNQIIRSELVYEITHPDGREERLIQPLALRYLFRWEAEHLLARSGFKVEHVYGDFEKHPFSANQHSELILEARL
jgi:SAM-dependent methyltransferase